ncbi:MAG: hypothetical protein QOJ79_1777 [Actinomycetota bacterium]|jgi:hypothetical protein|nr:hypothetical protein [Actinomycetota bacterium]
MRRRVSVLVALALLSGGGVAAAVMPDLDHPLDLENRTPRAEPSIAVDPRDPSHVAVTAMQFPGPVAMGIVHSDQPLAQVWVSRNGGAGYRSAGPLPLPRPKAQASEHATLAWDPHGPLYATYSAIPRYGETSVGAGVWVAKSIDGGRAWRLMSLVEGVHCSRPHRPVVAVDPVRGWVYVAWTHEVEPSCDGSEDGSQTSLRWSKSTDGGAHFGKPVEVTSAGAGDYPAPTVLPDGTLLVSYLEIGGLSLGDEVCPSVDQRVVVVRYGSTGNRVGEATAISRLCDVGEGLSANGATFTPVTYPAIVADPTTGAVAVAATYQGQVDRGVMIASSADGGRTWHENLLAGAPGTEVSLPALAAAGGRIALSYLTVQPGGTYLPTLVSSRDGGRTWSAPTDLATSPSVGNTHPQNGIDTYGFGAYQGVAVGPDGIVHAAWPDLRPRGADSQDVDIWTRDLS